MYVGEAFKLIVITLIIYGLIINDECRVKVIPEFMWSVVDGNIS